MKRRPASILPVMVGLGLLIGSTAAALWQPGCPVRNWTGLKCPSCGAGQSMEALLIGDPGGAIYWNAILLPLIIGLLAAGFGKPWKARSWLILVVGILGFGVLRNLPFYLLY